jgi:hypothetical protein
MSVSEPPHLRHQRYMLETGQWQVQSAVSGQQPTNVGDTDGRTEPERLHARVDAALRALAEAGWPGTQAIKADVPRGYRWLPRRQRVYGQGYDLGEQAVGGDESTGRTSLALMVKDGTPKFVFADVPDHRMGPEVVYDERLAQTLETLVRDLER